ncbi:STAS domain-containing protein [Zoogloea sp.]|uniref:STAS domain-containing protein n=1 Tax=Zoogloea sp. TaxID=49181 RepID=UPI00263354E0|nr:STAS domain-containing protein [Zoogloea sp.]MDD3354048.1 STAS domain-containing protein [Zoogloea sp.]
METNVSTQQSQVRIQLSGRFDFNSHREFREAVDRALGTPDTTEVAVDLGKVAYLDSSALGMLLMLRDKAKGVGKAVSLVNATGSVRQVLDIANFGKLFPIV